ncbi:MULTISPECIES: ABC transporter ATP-binding protein [Arthrobacter]|uniref:ABC transporter ATP-binding protein n=1 Tax=Arthrobacter jinronghuae TaxID=2964609 RepID=A0ABT1NQZ7_9MICC|nr:MULTISPECIES: ABC transporter ATP-binding protein [Arthrobacter]MCQ1950165.1 ABC transporter ATP-binding protein [Arthrobacter jinronghuae]MCQ1953436.1 ABC transporter ATP-binding protein [Arthrobacter sp. zg-Y238]MCQ1956670.1 ABC transporter ATP-binding protein [Arthrobacter jinronghuae]UWX77151.1 ABC transporter ATP-binding protein [Arthrobacter jinronghuae]
MQVPIDEPCLTIKGLIKDCGPVAGLDGKMIRVLAGVDFTARRGSVTALLGANGAGKTTTLECAQGLQSIDGGEIRLLGQDPYRADAHLRSRVGVMLQEGGLPPSARPVALLEHVARMYEAPRPVAELVDRLGIRSFADTGIRRLSGGQKQRLAMAAALIGRPEVLFLDEPSAGLDPQSRQIVFELISELRDEGLGIILTTHLMDDAQKLADYVYIIDAGKTVASGTVAELISSTGSTAEQRLLTFDAEPGLDVVALASGPLHHLEVEEAAPGHYGVRGALTPHDLAALAAWWAERNILPSSVHMASRTLEDVFLDLSGRTIR